MVLHHTRRDFITGAGITAFDLVAHPDSSTADAFQTTQDPTGHSWPQFRISPRNNAFVRSGKAPVNGTERWRLETQKPILSSPTIVDETVYVGSGDNNLYALQRTDGKKRWVFETGARVVSSPAVVDGTVYVGSGDANLYAINAETGEEVWRFETDVGVLSSPAVVNGTVYFFSFNASIYALDDGTGTKLWEVQTGSGGWSSPAVVNGTVYVGSGDGNLYALDATDGSEHWRFQAENSIDSSPAVVDGTVYVGSDDNNVYALDARTGTKRWQFETGGRVFSTPTVAGKRVYVGSNDGSLYALNATDGTKLWRTPLGGEIASSPTVVEDTVLVGTNDTRLYALNLTDGEERWRFETTDRIGSSPTVVDKTVYIGSTDGNLYAVESDRPSGSLSTVLSDNLDAIAISLLALAGGFAAWSQRTGRSSEEGSSSTAEPSDDSLNGSGFDEGGGGYTESVKRERKARHQATSKTDVDQVSVPEDGPDIDGGPPETVPRLPSLDITFDAIDIRETIGTGGNADVREGVVTVDANEYWIALKQPRFQGTVDADMVDRFLREAETWAKLDDHDNIVGVIDWGSTPTPWIALEYMDGGSLEARSGKMPLRQSLWTALLVLQGVRHAHEYGVAHLDLKPENVLFRTTGPNEWDVPKVGDWGLAKLLLEHSMSIDKLSPRYAAPEQFDPDTYGSPDKKTDIYQLGAVFYELFTGQPPVTGDGANVMYEVLEGDVVPPSKISSKVPQTLDEVLLTALSKRKSDRYESVLYLRDDLQNIYDSL